MSIASSIASYITSSNANFWGGGGGVGEESGPIKLSLPNILQLYCPRMET